MSLFMIGGVRCQLHPFNVNKLSEELEMPFARHEVLGGRTAHEKTGLHEEKLQLQGKIFPRRIGGKAEYDMLKGLLADGSAVLVTQGQTSRGWYVITRLSGQHEHLHADGVGQKMEIRIELELSQQPSSASAAGLVTRLFGYV